MFYLLGSATAVDKVGQFSVHRFPSGTELNGMVGQSPNARQKPFHVVYGLILVYLICFSSHRGLNCLTWPELRPRNLLFGQSDKRCTEPRKYCSNKELQCQTHFNNYYFKLWQMVIKIPGWNILFNKCPDNFTILTTILKKLWRWDFSNGKHVEECSETCMSTLEEKKIN